MSLPDRATRRFHEIEQQLPGLLDRLLSCDPSRAGKPTIPKAAGVYLFTERGEHLYVGRTRNFSQRYGMHTWPSSGHLAASFAFNIAKREAQRSSVVVTGTRAEISAAEPVAALFAEARNRVRAMDYRVVQIEDAALSTVFEVYAAIALNTEGNFNQFETT